MSIKVGSKIPESEFSYLTDSGINKISSSDLFKDKTMVVFAVPGAFTPVCSARHLPGYVENVAKFKAIGVDEIVCISVNDPFVMHAWAKDQNINDEVLMLADGNADFTKSIGLEMDATSFGMGARSERYAMVVEDSVVQYLFVEKPGEFEVSSAQFILEQLSAG
jgi:glutaredoxin/glutathione-dependent peroxiredoxin